MEAVMTIHDLITHVETVTASMLVSVAEAKALAERALESAKKLAK